MAELEPGGRSPAPGPLRLVQSFVNTADLESGSDELGTALRLRTWLFERGLMALGDRVSAEDLGRALTLREGLRALAMMNSGVPASAPSLRRLNSIAKEIDLFVRFAPDGGLELRPSGSGVDAAQARIVAAVATAILEGTWPRVKACRRDVCRWLFYDHSRNRSGVWCAMTICGSRTKARRYRRRLRAT